ncbi:MAG: hypothetical protein II572_08615, partial [Clostridia bacterium]|nr:hypothetical protein [Clostridia bacterium]
SNATYRVSLAWNGDASRGGAVPVEIVHAGGVATSRVDSPKQLFSCVQYVSNGGDGMSPEGVFLRLK